jgi:hypothetical protein
MKVYVFGNEYVVGDKRAIEVAKDVDTVQGIQDVTLLERDIIDKLTLGPRGSVHDYDLAFQLRYLKKLNKLGDVTVIGVPQEGEVDYLRSQSFFRKLVAHDMQGS